MEQAKQLPNELTLYGLWKIIAKRKRFVIGSCIITVISTAIISSMMPKIYRGEALLCILQYESIQTKEIVQAREIVEAKEIVDMIGIVDREMRTMILPTTHASVKDIKLKAIRDSKDKIIVTVDAKSVDEIPKALSELVDYINSFEIIQMTVKEEKEKLLKRSTELSDIVQSSADLSNTYRKLLSEGRLFPVGFNPVDLNKRIADIKLEKLSVDQRLQRLNCGGIEIAKQPYINHKPVKPKIILNVAFAGMGTILLCIFLVAFLDYIDRLKNENMD